jgi:hypothetical protein
MFLSVLCACVCFCAHKECSDLWHRQVLNEFSDVPPSARNAWGIAYALSDRLESERPTLNETDRSFCKELRALLIAHEEAVRGETNMSICHDALLVEKDV